ncbi:hypothetical protein GCM10007216_25420 [Thalassobacillus devorans]|uniref:Restriction endonuclease n=1 Tax=Thalassobacillus devorans TaxID=279813 RepID=A0ABQ1PB50_9BACI|nr:hypothetical protein GCM10007216_25420 [Thalassobacillus devorans]
MDKKNDGSWNDHYISEVIKKDRTNYIGAKHKGALFTTVPVYKLFPKSLSGFRGTAFFAH